MPLIFGAGCVVLVCPFTAQSHAKPWPKGWGFCFCTARTSRHCISERIKLLNQRSTEVSVNDHPPGFSKGLRCPPPDGGKHCGLTPRVCLPPSACARAWRLLTYAQATVGSLFKSLKLPSKL